MSRLKSVPVGKVKLDDAFLAPRQRLIQEVVLPYQWEVLNDRVEGVPPSHAIRNFRVAAGEEEGSFGGRVFQDSDVAKWLEAVAYVLAINPDPKLEEAADQVIDLVVRAQKEDGYLNTYYTIEAFDRRWTNTRDDHEMYCAGHMIEAAVAYYQSTGKRKLLDAVCRFADHIDELFGPGDNQKPGYPGHPELELALYKLYEVTGEKRYLDLAQFFVNQRGEEPNWFVEEAKARGESRPFGFLNDLRYYQAHKPLRQQETAEGHSVRALYLFSGVADVASASGDDHLLDLCKKIWRNVTERRMYVTGGVGSESTGERFTFDYDLPNDRAYAETCAAIALVFFARRMLELDPRADYADVMELALYNGVASGMSYDGKAFFYVNPLEVWPEATAERHDTRHVEPTRPGWFDCACCPPNLARLFSSIGSYAYNYTDDAIYVHLYAQGEAEFDLPGGSVRLIQKTRYPWDGQVVLSVEPEEAGEFTVALRVPGWCQGAKLTVNDESIALEETVENGYARLQRRWEKGDRIALHLPMPVTRVVAHPQVRENAGRVAIKRGPIVYCLEEVDNGSNLHWLRLPKDAELSAHWDADLLGGTVKVTGPAVRIDSSGWNGLLYRGATEGRGEVTATSLTAIPYALWANRTPGEMTVWIGEM